MIKAWSVQQDFGFVFLRIWIQNGHFSLDRIWFFKDGFGGFFKGSDQVSGFGLLVFQGSDSLFVLE